MKWFERGQASCSELRLNGANFKDKHCILQPIAIL
jgi:hypothetical protein